MLDWEEHSNLNWADTIALLEQRELNVPAELAFIMNRLLKMYYGDKINVDKYFQIIAAKQPIILKYKQDVEKYLLLM